LSGTIRQEQIFAHLGWRKHGTQWVYLHAWGALGANGPQAVRVGRNDACPCGSGRKYKGKTEINSSNYRGWMYNRCGQDGKMANPGSIHPGHQKNGKSWWKEDQL
jgi:hypothetical protein